MCADVRPRPPPPPTCAAGHCWSPADPPPDAPPAPSVCATHRAGGWRARRDAPQSTRHNIDVPRLHRRTRPPVRPVSRRPHPTRRVHRDCDHTTATAAHRETPPHTPDGTARHASAPFTQRHLVRLQHARMHTRRDQRGLMADKHQRHTAMRPYAVHKRIGGQLEHIEPPVRGRHGLCADTRWCLDIAQPACGVSHGASY